MKNGWKYFLDQPLELRLWTVRFLWRLRTSIVCAVELQFMPTVQQVDGGHVESHIFQLLSTGYVRCTNWGIRKRAYFSLHFWSVLKFTWTQSSFLLVLSGCLAVQRTNFTGHLSDQIQLSSLWMSPSPIQVCLSEWSKFLIKILMKFCSSSLWMDTRLAPCYPFSTKVVLGLVWSQCLTWNQFFLVSTDKELGPGQGKLVPGWHQYSASLEWRAFYVRDWGQELRPTGPKWSSNADFSSWIVQHIFWTPIRNFITWKRRSLIAYLTCSSASKCFLFHCFHRRYKTTPRHV